MPKKLLIIFDLDDTLFPRLADNYTENDLNDIKPYPGVGKLLVRNDFKKILVSKGEPESQYKKLAALRIKRFFDEIIICSTAEEKRDIFRRISLRFSNEAIWVVGDRIDSEIRYGNELGFKTVLLKRGKYKDLKAKDDSEMADFEFGSFKEIAHFFEKNVLKNADGKKMKAVILAAGKGTRMLPLTEKIPKVLVEVNNKPFLYYVLASLKKAGFRDFGIIVGYKKEKFPAFLKKYGFKATLIEQKEQLGTGHALLQAKNFVENENFIVLGGDNLWSVEDFRLMKKEDNLNYISGIEVSNPKEYGILIAEGNFLKEIKEKPELKEKPAKNYGNLINAALYKFTPEIFIELEKVKPSSRGEIELTDAVTALAKKGKVKIIKAEWWLDLGRKEDIPKVEKFLKGDSVLNSHFARASIGNSLRE